MSCVSFSTTLLALQHIHQTLLKSDVKSSLSLRALFVWCTALLQTGDTQTEQVSVRGHPSLSVYSLEDGDEEVEQKDVGEQQIDTQHEDGQPLWEGRHVLIVQHGTFGLQRIGAVHTTAAHIKLSVWITTYTNISFPTKSEYLWMTKLTCDWL